MLGDVSSATGEGPWEFDERLRTGAASSWPDRDRVSAAVAGRLMADSERAFQEAGAAWRAALRDRVLARPMRASARLANLAASAAQRASACEAAYKDGLEWPRGAVVPTGLTRC